MFRQFTIFQYRSESRKAERNSSVKNLVCDFPHRLQNNLRLGSQEIMKCTGNIKNRQPSIQSSLQKICFQHQQSRIRQNQTSKFSGLVQLCLISSQFLQNILSWIVGCFNCSEVKGLLVVFICIYAELSGVNFA